MEMGGEGRAGRSAERDSLFCRFYRFADGNEQAF